MCWVLHIFSTGIQQMQNRGRVERFWTPEAAPSVPASLRAERLSARQPWARKNDGYILHKWLYDGYRMDINKICIYIHILKNHWYILWLYHGHYIMDINIYIYIYICGYIMDVNNETVIIFIYWTSRRYGEQSTISYN